MFRTHRRSKKVRNALEPALHRGMLNRAEPSISSQESLLILRPRGTGEPAAAPGYFPNPPAQ
jgi:hypothetical protein